MRKLVFRVSDQVRHKPGCARHLRWLEARNFGFRKWRDCSIHIAKTKALISFPVTVKLICVFVFAYAKSQFSHDAAHISVLLHFMNDFE